MIYINEEKGIGGLREKIQTYQDERERLLEKLDELEEREERLKKELERVRNHLTYYESLVADMKKRMQGGRGLSILEHL